jgi:hypothetical protein
MKKKKMEEKLFLNFYSFYSPLYKYRYIEENSYFEKKKKKLIFTFFNEF